MKILVATKETQKQRSNDFCFADEGEAVCFGSECDGEAVDGKCGCRRAMIGVLSGKPTTTMKVVDRDNYTVDMLKDAIHASLSSRGWIKEGDGDEEWAKDFVHSQVEDLVRIGGAFKVGDIVEKRGNGFRQRIPPKAILVDCKKGATVRIHYNDPKTPEMAKWQDRVVQIDRVLVKAVIAHTVDMPPMKVKVDKSLLRPV